MRLRCGRRAEPSLRLRTIAVLVKDNHIAAAGGIDERWLSRAAWRIGPMVKIEIEVDTRSSSKPRRGSRSIDAILLDKHAARDQ